ncbi:hypothetical protein HRE53_14050 [Acaryochloris sp. 'Moss Beach']|uniref:hypothetical protein n=1 Tax=Acaryochloris sp. 'Moss Beach' TaxID=2740837 RepID=UPI001F260BE0|nr:hypothetical protein [Acaryochloris sp. 'Moss Beach']UJB67790.1 hypothetical protein HRE53_14050 [Acaryochloris sp. 'Moss Beach']
MDYVELAAGLSTPVLAVIAAYIAWQQLQTNRLKVKLDLYERRLAIYTALIQFLSVILREAKASDDDALIFLQKTRESYFLFGVDISEYLNTVYRNWVQLRRQNVMLNDSQSSLPIGQERQKLVAEKQELLKWFEVQFETGREKFSPYMTLV